jgi:hypothetical protein
MFDRLSDKLSGVFQKLAGRGKVNEADLKSTLREVRLAEYQAADPGRLAGPEGRTFEYFLALNKGNLLHQVWRLGLYEASRDRIEIPPNFLQ